MKTYNTKYGTLTHLGEYTLHENGNLKDAVILEKIELTTPIGALTPQYEYADHRRKYIYSISFYENGALRRISLNNKTEIETPKGAMTAELITFYESGKIKRVFPLNGHISAYWEENDEFQLAEEELFEFSFGTFKAKIIAISFYENGAVKDLTFWPNEKVKIHTPLGDISVRIGISLYPNGQLKSLEPAYQVGIQTLIGLMKAFDYNANGITGDRNSLIFSKEGALQSMISSGIQVIVQSKENDEWILYSPQQEVDEDGIEICFNTLKIEFEENNISFNDGEKYDLSKYEFIIKPYNRPAPSQCSDCASCGLCSK
ncbi:MAG: hypothetical protein ACYDEX_09995 [Mobilitalea sp.]